jgi:adenylylsulfate kinase
MNKTYFAIWLTGLPGSGKSAISDKLKKILFRNKIKCHILRMDEMRKVVTPQPTYSDQERQIVYNSFCYLAKKLVNLNNNIIMDATGNLRKYRKLAKEIIPNFLEIYLKCPLELAIKREMQRRDTREAPKDIYKRAIKGETKTVPGLQSEYEPPLSPDLIVNTGKFNIEESANKIFKLIEKKYL